VLYNFRELFIRHFTGLDPSKKEIAKVAVSGLSIERFRPSVRRIQLQDQVAGANSVAFQRPTKNNIRPPVAVAEKTGNLSKPSPG
jgi:hypothetical protein